MIFDNRLLQNISQSFNRIIKSLPKQSSGSKQSSSSPNQEIKFIDPLGGKGTITSELNRLSGKLHGGLDIGVPTGTKVMAAGDGIVVDVEYHSDGFGHVVVIQHPNGLQSSYAHLGKRPRVTKGQTIKQGEVLGIAGSTGKSTGPHLDFRIGKKLWNNEIWNYAKDAEVVNPYDYVNFIQPKNIIG